ncbi:glycosyltransferase family 4 protein [Colwellia sp. C1TZA3]|uniref:glycosyltransferase family 4 protein n=1 Tax=Colwellia sp. C1TZA3 TaxID=2508879 RepID=UPI0011B9C6BA|nr:glycosyltransferase family 4 protein [Colwellia sp. C1TZA3]TWX63728.1 glycosyltransferase [Colwellia sp. C1TZA3]
MKILFLTPELPYPTISGGTIKSFKIVEHLLTNHDVTLGCLIKGSQEQTPLTTFKKALPRLKTFSFNLDRKRNIKTLLSSYALFLPLTIYRNYSVELKKKVNSIADKYDVIFIDHYLMFQYIPPSFRGRIVIHQHNAEFVMWSRYAKLVKNPIKKLLLLIESYRIKRYELRMIERTNVTLAAPNDKAALIGGGANSSKFINTFHLGDARNLTLKNLTYENTQLNILYIGTLTWEANIDGLLWFLKHSWPLIKAQQPNVVFTIVGRCSPKMKNILLKLEPKLNLLGFVEHLDVLYQTHRVFICPLRFGSGIKVKVINSLYRGIPTVMTPIAAEGIALNNAEHAYITSDMADFAYCVLELLKNKTKWRSFSEKSRVLMHQHYTWDKVFINIDKSVITA